jgi:hypothetical protein
MRQSHMNNLTVLALLVLTALAADITILTTCL